MLKRKSNFTLIELIVVIVVLGILAAIVIPNITNVKDNAQDARLTADVRNVQTAYDMYMNPLNEDVNKDALYDGDALTTAEGDVQVIDVSELHPEHLRDVPTYGGDAANYEFGVLLDDEGESTGVVKLINPTSDTEAEVIK